MREDTCRDILIENEARLKKLRAEYDPVSGEGLGALLGEERAPLKIRDFPIRKQWVPAEMMNVELVKGIAEAGSIKRYIRSRKWETATPSAEDIEKQLRRIRHKYDFCFWAFFCITIDAKLGGRVRFRLNYPQLVTLSRCEAMRKAGSPIDIIILKARQWGGSTFCIFYQTWIAFKWDPYHSFVVAADGRGV